MSKKKDNNVFTPHLSSISVKRSEPTNIDTGKQIKEIRKRNISLAEKIVIEDWLKRKKPKNKKKLKRVIEFEERAKLTGDFMDIWNYWRNFYFKLPPLKIKTAGQISAIESIKELCEEEGLNLNIMIAASHKAYTWNKMNLRPGFSSVVSRGREWYDRYSNEIEKDIDKEEYQEDSLG